MNDCMGCTHASKRKVACDKYHANFAEFLKLSEESGEDGTYLDDDATTGVTQAY